MKLSVIIPVYNVAETLPRCIESLLKQNFSELEFLLVDDSSTDTSGKLCDQYAQQFSFIRVIHQPHGGLSVARNTGIDHATGDYLTFVDSDDAVAERTYDQLMRLLQQSPDIDMLEYPVYERFGNQEKQHLLTFKNQVYSDEMGTFWLQQRVYQHTYAWNKIYKRQLFQDLRYPIGRKFEDAYLLPKLLQRCHKVTTTDQGLYYYYYNDQGITSQADGKALQDLLSAHNETLLWANDSAYYAAVINIALDVYDATGKVPYLLDLPYKNTLKEKVKHLLGFKRLCLLHKIIHRRHS